MYQRWMNDVKVGDVLVGANKRMRVVRHVAHYRSGSRKGQLHGVSFAIKHCSWTGRCYTAVGYNDLYQLGYRPTGKRVRLNRRIDKRIARDLEYANRFNQKTTCCDVEGVA